MQLKSLEVNGFKSFGKKVKLDFNAPISAIVGPNGSGKSNIAEGFRFVLGEQSMKSMRGKRGEDLIFSGNQNAPKQNRASVKLTFDNSDKKLPIDFEEVMLERVVHRDGVNEYLINGSQVRLKDVSEMLASANIGSSGHNIISQGEADRILNSSVKERKEMLEDALGLRVYQYKKIESLRKLEKTQDNIKEVESLRREIAPHIKFLKKQVEKIEEGRQLKINLREFYKSYLKIESEYLKKERASIDLEIKEPRERLFQIESEIKKIQDRADAENSIDQTGMNQIREIENRLNENNRLHSELTREIGQVEGEINSVKKVLERSENSVSEKISVSQSEINALENAIQEYENFQNDDLESLRLKFQNLLSKIKGFLQEKIQKNSAENDLAGDFKADLERLNARQSDLNKKIRDVESQSEALKKQIETKRQEIEQDKSDTVALEKQIIELMTEKNELQSKMSKFAVRSDALDRDEGAFKQELTEAAILVGREVLDYENYHGKDDVENAAQNGSEDLAQNGAENFADELEQKISNREAQLDDRRKLERMKIKVEELGIGSGDEVLKEFQEVSERDEFLIKEISDLEKSAENLRNLIVELEEKIDNLFKQGIQKINQEFQKFFELMFGGGNAALQVVKTEVRRRRDTDLDFDSENIEDLEVPENEEEGIDIKVNLPRKKINSLMMLSGGERALTSIALLFAISQVNPPPFIILDETDAALDESNSRKYGDMIENLAKYSQLILITHNRETMSRAGIIYGVTMVSGVSELLSIAFDEGLQYAK